MEQRLKKEWQKTSFRHTSQEQIDNSINGRLTSLEKLARRYRRFCIFAICMIPLNVNIIANIFPDESMMWLALCYSVCLLSSAVVDFLLYKGIRGINCRTMSVIEVARRALKCRKRHLQSIMVLAPMAFATVGLTAYFATSDSYMIAGIIVGAAVGLILGSLQLREFMRDYREVTGVESE